MIETKLTIMTKIALDTNVLIYNHSTEDAYKQDIAHKLLCFNPVVSVQVVSEYINVMRRLLPIPKSDLIELSLKWMSKCNICRVDVSTMKIAKHLIQCYDFQVFDSIIVASAIEAACDILYSEDMQHNLEVDGVLRIVNPFV